VLGAAVAGAASYILRDVKPGQTPTEPINPTPSELNQLYWEAAGLYLTHFRRDAIAILRQYEATVAPTLNPPIASATEPDRTDNRSGSLHHQAELQLLQGVVNNLEQAIAALQKMSG